jgi:hypothetical protein
LDVSSELSPCGVAAEVLVTDPAANTMTQSSPATVSVVFFIVGSQRLLVFVILGEFTTVHGSVAATTPAKCKLQIPD